MRRSLVIFALLVLVQWAVPWWGIHQNERVLREGVAFRFRTAPVDPHDPFRGEYVALRFTLENDTIPHHPDEPWTDGEHVYVVLGERDGEAYIERVERTRPALVPYVTCTMNVYSWGFNEGNRTATASIDLPFDRFYLQQGKGPRTESLLAGRSVEDREALPAYAVVRILNGRAVIEDLVVGDRSIHKWFMDE